MKNKIIAGLAFIFLMAAISSFVLASNIWVLGATSYGVQTSSGTIDLPSGTTFRSQPSDSDYQGFLLKETRIFETTQGSQEIPLGTWIDCFHEPYTPSACMGY